MADIAVRHLGELAEFEACMELERAVWGSAEIDVVPLPIFVVAAHTGGQVLGAYDGNRLVGFTLAVAGFRGGPFLHSHMTAVAPEYRDQGVGRQLKLFQREDALKKGIGRVEWTFDPLELKNAYFNLERLGAIARRYLPNVYGITTSPLHGGLPTDRLLAEWWLESPRVKRSIAGQSIPGRRKLTERIAVPVQIGAMRRDAPGEAGKVQARIREEFSRCFAQGTAVTGIEIQGEKGEYLLEPLGAPEVAE